MELETVFRVLQIALGIGLVIFVHELGHFLAARLCRVRVEVFSIGMGPRILSWVRGTTRYQLALMPIGGYVRMAGEERRADGLPPRHDDLSAKSVGARFFIYSGGVLMNLVFGLVVFPLIFYVGVPLPRPVLGDPLPGGPAWEADLPGGTEVLEVNGREVFDYVHIQTAIALGDPSGSELLVKKPRVEEPLRVEIVPRYDEGDGLYTIDAGFDWERGPEGGFVLEIEEGSPLWNAGARTGDLFLGIEGAQPGLSPLDQWGLAANGAPVAVRLAGPGGERTVLVAPIEGPLQRARAGILPPRNLVAGKRKSALDLPLAQGDRLLEVAGRAILRHGDLQAALWDAAEGDRPVHVPFSARRDGVTFTGALELASRADALALADDLALEMDLETTRILVNPGEPAALAGVRDLDDVLRVNGVEVAGWEDTSRLIREASEREEPVVMSLRRSGEGQGVLELTVVPKRIAVPDYGFGLKQQVYVYRADGLGDAIRVGALCSWRFTQETYLTVKRLLTRDVDPKNLGGIISIGAISYSFAESGWTKLFFFLCLLSINLAVLNVLPIPLLDGGHLLFLLVEKVKGSPVSERVLVYSQVVGLVLILFALVFITYNDIVRWFLPPV